MSHRRVFFIVGLVACLLAVLFTPTQAQDDGGGHDVLFEQEILDRLAKINPEAALLFDQATLASDNEDYETAIAGFKAVLDLAPDFPDALRRLSFCELELDLNQTALEHAQRAYDLDPNGYNQAALAYALLHEGSPASETKAFNLAREAVAQLPDDSYSYSILIYAAAFTGNKETLRTACETLFRLAPQSPGPHYYYGLLAAEEGKWEKAEAELLIAQELGIPPEDIQQLLAETNIANMARLLPHSALGRLPQRGVAERAGFAAISRDALELDDPGDDPALAEHVTSTAQPRRKAVALFLPDDHRLNLGLFLYLDPFVLLIVVAATAGVFYLFFTSGYIPFRLLIIIGLTAIYTLYVTVRSVFVRVKQVEPGRPLERGEAPALWRLTDEVAKKLETQPIQSIYITPSVEVAVTEQGGIWKKLAGKGRRSLILGLGALNGMTQGQFKSVLAHEYGHFTGKDTAGGDLARQVQISVYNMAYGLAVRGVQICSIQPGFSSIAFTASFCASHTEHPACKRSLLIDMPLLRMERTT